MKQTLLVTLGAVVGGALGYFGFFWIAGQGFYAMVLPGGLLGIGAGLAKNRSLLLAIGCGLVALALGLFTEWRFRPFVKDDSLGYFLMHVWDLTPITLLMIVAGGFVGFWMPFRRIERIKRDGDEQESPQKK